MEGSDRDVTPMLSNIHLRSDDGNNSTNRNFSSRTRSASMSIPMSYHDSSEQEEQSIHNFVGFTGPLRTERRNTFIQMSGPLRANRNNEFVFKPPQVQNNNNNVEPQVEKYPSSIDRTNDDDDWLRDDYAGKNAHLLRSGQLGMCNDPYCTTCPTYFNVNKERQKHSRTSEIFDAKVILKMFSLYNIASSMYVCLFY